LRYNAGTYAGDVLALMDALAIASAVFVGTSMGGLITMVVAATRPAAVTGAALNDVGPEVDPAGMARISAFTGQAPAVETWDEAAAYAQRINGFAFPHYGPEQWTSFARRLFAEKDGKPAPGYDPAIAVALKPPETEPSKAPSPLPDLWPLFTALAGRPLLTLRGADSDILSRETVQKMREVAPQMAYAEVKGVGHAPMLDEPEALAAIDTLLETAP
jgi:pimeloyl-ACP methyl ester carboxylesterase